MSTTCEKTTLTQKRKKKSKFAEMVFQKNYLTLSWPNFSQIGSRVANLEFLKNVPSTCPDFHFEKTVVKEFWQRIIRDKIITDYNTKAVNVDAYQRRENNSDKVGKG